MGADPLNLPLGKTTQIVPAHLFHFEDIMVNHIFNQWPNRVFTFYLLPWISMLAGLPCLTALPGSSCLTSCRSRRLGSGHTYTAQSYTVPLAVSGPGMAVRMRELCWVWPPCPPWAREPRVRSPWSQSLMNFCCPRNLFQRLHSWPCWQAPHCSQFHCESHHRWTRPPLEHCLAGHFHLAPQHCHWITHHPSDQIQFCWPCHPIRHLTDCQVDHWSLCFHGHLCHSSSNDSTRSWSWTTPSYMGESLSKCMGCDLPVEEMLQTL